ncbi:MAG: Asp-tRNA(Asn)/Glu-tRNA(Gln) amidotransferase GatCAB subunit B, partial [Candidatus Latescibacterota bacterium]|nr:Asp-tRNA(Asn)/Glu-tRNA(Gln) amidotransferase GatCAB subunit B [Candidatus Latescibacterota bacterium]
KVQPQQLGNLLQLVADDTISGSAAKDVFGIMWDSGGEPDQIVEQKGLKQISDSSELETAVDSVIEEQGEAADKVRGGDEKPIQFLMGQVMRSTKGKANPQLVQQLLRDRLLT